MLILSTPQRGQQKSVYYNLGGKQWNLKALHFPQQSDYILLKNLIDLKTLDLNAYDRQLVRAQWWDYLNIVCGFNDNKVESFITEHGYLIPSDWLDTYFGFVQ